MVSFTADRRDYFFFRPITFCIQVKITLKGAYLYLIGIDMCTLVIPEPTGTRMPVLSKMTFDIFLPTPLSPFTDFIFPLPWLWCAISFGTLHVLELLRHPMPSSDRWKGQIDRLLTSCCVVKIPALRRMSSCSPVTPVKDQSDLWLSMSFTQDNNGTSFTNLLGSRQSWEQGLPTIALNADAQLTKIPTPTQCKEFATWLHAQYAY